MSGMTAEKKKTLDGLIVEYGVSLDRSEDEKVKRKAMEEKAGAMDIEPKHFKALATTIWKDIRKAVQDDLGAQLDLFALYDDHDDEERKEVQAAYRWLNKNGVTLESVQPGALQ